ncbi:MAG: gamma-glutamyl-gamma-aminobutyrate hydrolase family protein [Parachlamydiaceae bacterium]|nr:gamma-glutamyl-gamma-aminobutyrate hydrolase family protein [Parachlamydiaceae bacterium]
MLNAIPVAIDLIKDDTQAFDANRRVDPILKNTKTQRIVDVAIPFLCLYRPTAVAVQVGLGCMKSGKLSSRALTHFRAGDWKNFTKTSFKLALVITSTALTILLPSAQLLASQSYHLFNTLYKLQQGLVNRQWNDALSACLELLVTTIFLASVIQGAAELIALSMILQALKELYGSIHDLRKGLYLEGVAKLAMAAIRGHQACPHIRTAHRNLFGSELTKEKFEEFVESEEKETLDQFLVRNNISGHIKGITFESFQDKTINNVKLQDCTFTEQSADVVFANVKFTNCSFKDSSFWHTLFQNCSFQHSNFTDAVLNECTFNQVTFFASDFTRACFNDSIMQKVNFHACTLLETNFHAVQAKNSKIVNSDLTDCLLLGTKKQFTILGGTPHKITRPVVGLAWNFRFNGAYAVYINKAIQKEKAISLKFDYEPFEMDTFDLKKEVEGLVTHINANKPYHMLSRADEMLRLAPEDSQIGQISKKMAELMVHIDALALPGGEDVEELFYKDKPLHEDINYVRSVMEFAAVREAVATKTPTIGICRGSQLVNVYFGGTLRNVDHHFDELHDLRVNDSVPAAERDFFKGIIGADQFAGVSMHHQAIDQVGKDLTVVIDVDGSPEASVSKDRNFVLTQFHPEFAELYRESLGTQDTTMEDLQRQREIYSNALQLDPDNTGAAAVVRLMDKSIEHLREIETKFNEVEAAKNQRFFTHLIRRQMQKSA